MIEVRDVRPGSVVIVRGDFGQGVAVKAVVEGVEAHGKNGRAVIDYQHKGNSHWAYLHQVDCVVSY